jgi:hypothetical protein
LAAGYWLSAIGYRLSAIGYQLSAISFFSTSRLLDSSTPRLTSDVRLPFHACGADRGAPSGDHIAWEAVAAALRAVVADVALVIESFTPGNQTIARAAIWRPLAESQNALAEEGLAFLGDRVGSRESGVRR